jgi:hypothetical protein
MNKRHVQHIKPVDSTQVHATLVSLLTDTLPWDLEVRDLDEETRRAVKNPASKSKNSR